MSLKPAKISENNNLKYYYTIKILTKNAAHILKVLLST